MDIYFDTEFTDFVVDPVLISIGFVSVDGKEFYAELNDTYCEGATANLRRPQNKDLTHHHHPF